MSNQNESSVSLEDSNDSMIIDDNNVEQSSGDDDNMSDLDSSNLGNSAWADAMCKVLNTNVSKEKNFILSKAKKDKVVNKVKEKKEIELVDESGNVLNVKKSSVEQEVKSYKEKRKEMLEKQKRKVAWESMCRVKPDVTNKDRERELVRIATRGVVHLFNTVEKHQKSKKDPKEKSSKKKSLGAVKGNFMDILKGHSKEQLSTENDPVLKKVQHEETWNILKDDFMMGAEMKDWDKDSDNDQ